MSGGFFDYDQYKIEHMAYDLRRKLKRLRKPRPPKRMFKDCSIRRYYGERETDYELDWHMNQKRYMTKEEAIEVLRKFVLDVDEKDGRFFDTFRTWKDKDGNEHPCEYKIHEYEYEDYEDHVFREEFSEETLAKIEEGMNLMFKAAIYAQRIDWLLSGDDGEESFHERLKDDLENIDTIYADNESDEDDEED